MTAPAVSTPVRRRGLPLWGVIVVAMLLAHVIMMLAAVTIATRDRNFQVIPDYYRRAVNWDQTKALERASAKLGWVATLEAEQAAAPLRLVTLSLVDPAGEPVRDAAVEANYFHDSHIHDGRTATLTPRPDGTYAATLPMSWEGFWTFELTVTRGRDTFISTVSLYAADRK